MNTTILLKRSANHIRFYTPMVSRGFLYGVWQTALWVVAALHEWKLMMLHNIPVLPIDHEILWFGCVGAAVGSWFSYTDKTKAQFDEKKRIRDETSHTNLSEEEYLKRELAKSQKV